MKNVESMSLWYPERPGTSSKIIGIQFSILSPHEIQKGSVAEIVNRDTHINNKPVIGGLFDPRMGVLDPGYICPSDGLDYVETPGYFGHVNLARPVFYIQYLTTIMKILRLDEFPLLLQTPHFSLTMCMVRQKKNLLKFLKAFLSQESEKKHIQFHSPTKVTLSF